MEAQKNTVECAIAMQYNFALPADYDMAIVERRIRDKGPLLDNLPRLRLKATSWRGATRASARTSTPRFISGTSRRG
jgi:hypothetical protein